MMMRRLRYRDVYRDTYRDTWVTIRYAYRPPKYRDTSMHLCIVTTLITKFVKKLFINTQYIGFEIYACPSPPPHSPGSRIYQGRSLVEWIFQFILNSIIFPVWLQAIHSITMYSKMNTNPNNCYALYKKKSFSTCNRI